MEWGVAHNHCIFPRIFKVPSDKLFALFLAEARFGIELSSVRFTNSINSKSSEGAEAIAVHLQE